MGRVTARRALLRPLAAAVLIGLSTVPVRAESLLWTLTATPLTATTGVATTFTLTATNQDPLAATVSGSEIGCVVVTLPASFSVGGAAVSGSSAGGSWSASVDGTRVVVRAGSGGDRLAFLDWVRFTVVATPKSAGSLVWNAKAYRQQDCSGAGAVLGVPPVIVVVGATVTPSPMPTVSSTPKPTPAPTSSPTPSPTPLVTVPRPSLPPLPLPTDGSGPSPVPSALGTPGPSASDRPEETDRAPDPAGPAGEAGERPPSASPAPSPTDGTSGASPPVGGGGASDGGLGDGGLGGGAAAMAHADPGRSDATLGFDGARLELGSGSFDVLDGLDVWAVPAATIAGPGLLVLLWIALQSIGAAVWLPAARRLRSGSDAARRRRRARGL